MKRLLSLGMAMVVLQCVGCGDSHDSLMEEQISTMKKMVSILEGIKDEDSARSAKSSLESVAKQMKDIQTRASKLPTPTAEEGKALLAKHSKEMDDLVPRMTQQMFRLGMDPKIGPILRDIDMDMKGGLK